MTTLFYNGKIHSMDETLTTATAMVVCGGKIMELGADHALMQKYPDADLHDLAGSTVIPGLIDSHAHMFMAADSEGDGELFIPDSVEQLLEDLARRVKTVPKGEWIGYKNTYPLRLRELRYPTREELDRIAPEHPVAVDGFYSAQLNSCALAAVDLNALPAGGRVMRDASGAPTGVLLGCFGMLVSHYPTRKEKPLDRAVAEVMTAYNRMGITTSIEGMSHKAGIDAVEQLQRAGEQTVRVRYTMMVPPRAQHAEFIRDVRAISCANPELARVAFLKNTIDGGILTATSLMDGEYRGLSEIFGLDGLGADWRGNLVTDVPTLCDSIRLAQENHLQFGAHCVGTQAARKLLAAYERVGGTAGQRHVLIHADFMDAGMIEKAKELDLTVLFQPAWHYMDAPVLERVLNARECACFMPYMSLLASGVHAAAGSDHMVKYDPIRSVNPYHPFVALHNMVTCRARDGQAHGAHQAIDRISALLYYTRHAAWASFDEELTGSLQPGLRADFLILDRDYFTCPEEEICEVRPVATYMDGRCVYHAK